MTKKIVNKIFLSAHQDDESLFGAYTIMREKPLVIICTDSYIQEERGEDATNEQRTLESKKAMKLLGADVVFLHIPDKYFKGGELAYELSKINIDKKAIVYAPAIEEGGNPIHNEVGKISDELFHNVKHYMTYGSANYTKTKGKNLVIPTLIEMELKKKALAIYESQMRTQCKAFFTNKEILNYESFQ